MKCHCDKRCDASASEITLEEAASKAYQGAQEIIKEEQQSLDRYAISSFAGVVGAVGAVIAGSNGTDKLPDILLTLIPLAAANYFLQIVLTLLSHMLSIKIARQQEEKLFYIQNEKLFEGRVEMRYRKTKRETIKQETLYLGAINAITPWIFILATILLCFGLVLGGFNKPDSFFTLLVCLVVELIILVILYCVRLCVIKSRLPLQEYEYFKWLWPDESGGEKHQ